jgi:phosphoglycerate dehydrogenase-like enzyme
MMSSERATGGDTQVRGTTQRRVVVAIAAPLSPELAARIRVADDRLDVRYQPELLSPHQPPRGQGQPGGFHRTQAQETRWQEMLNEAEIVFGLPEGSPAVLADLVRTNRGLRWVQANTEGADELVRSAGLGAEELERVRITNAPGVHAVPLAEFAIFGVLAFAKQLPHLLADTQLRHWDHYPMNEIAGQTLLVIGLGPVGAEVARLGKAFGMTVSGVNRTGHGTVPGVEAIRPPRFLADLLPTAHAVVITLPLTEQTRGLIDAQAISRMRSDAVLVNVGHGSVVNEQALIDGLAKGQPAAAVLDVFATEPLPAESPLWHMPNVLISPHTAALSVRGNERIITLFTENLRRYLRGDDLLGLIEPASLD